MPLSQLHKHTARLHDYPLLTINIMPKSRQLLHQRIQQRLDNMFQQGFVEEVECLLKIPGIDLNSAAMRSVGYRQVASYLKGNMDLNEAQDQSLFATRQFAKRQMTWLRRYFNEVCTLYSDESDDLVRKFMSDFLN
jgi:tRNA dimethylallyltransferase